MTKERMKQYQHDWYQKNKDRIRIRKNDSSKEYYHRHKEIIQNRRKESYKENYDIIRAKRMEYINNNKEHIAMVKNERSKIYRLDLKFDAIEAYGGECAICGEFYIECLTIDHSNNDGAKFRKDNPKLNIGYAFYLWLRKNNYPKDLGLRVLCFNCNCSIGAYGYSPYEKIMEV